ncbi:hypothetical protein SeMB42_g02953 [Synchytrium endobioticum]|uniref:Uncharacterized protein n=1 Tax=Synchytrium endobioticum TaxID=286115 RepID=A0A507DAD6_9FUNG|nr:hypothetical protein SeMB42_g02953 [Synchytrium endobioticum]
MPVTCPFVFAVLQEIYLESNNDPARQLIDLPTNSRAMSGYNYYMYLVSMSRNYDGPGRFLSLRRSKAFDAVVPGGVSALLLLLVS